MTMKDLVAALNRPAWEYEVAPAPEITQLYTHSMGRRWQDQLEWSDETFGPERHDEGMFDHLEEEFEELKERPDDVTEAIDIIFLCAHHAMNVLREMGVADEDLGATLESFWVAKFNKNKRREWPDWRTADRTKGIKHVKGIED